MASRPLAKVNHELKKYRNLPEKGWAMGVCAGLAYRIGWPAWVVRMGFVALLLFGVGLLAYLLVGFIAPDGHTPKDYVRRTGG